LRRVPAPRMNLSPTLGRARLPPSRQPLGRARRPPSRGWKQTVVIAVFGWIYFTTEYTEYTETRRRDCRAVCVCRRWLSMSGAGLGGARRPRSRGIQRLDRRSAQQELRPPKRQAFGSAGASPSQRQCSAQRELRPPKDRGSAQQELRPPKRQAFGSAGASPSQKAGVRLSRSFALPKAVFGSAGASPSQRQAVGSAEASHYQRGNNVAGQSAGAHLTSR
jgi:hypothetical protein